MRGSRTTTNFRRDMNSAEALPKHRPHASPGSTDECKDSSQGLWHSLTSEFMSSPFDAFGFHVTCAPARHAAVARVPVASGGGADGLAVHAGQVQPGRQAVQLPLQRLQELRFIKPTIYCSSAHCGLNIVHAQVGDPSSEACIAACATTADGR